MSFVSPEHMGVLHILFLMGSLGALGEIRHDQRKTICNNLVVLYISIRRPLLVVQFLCNV